MKFPISDSGSDYFSQQFVTRFSKIVKMFCLRYDYDQRKLTTRNKILTDEKGGAPPLLYNIQISSSF